MTNWSQMCLAFTKQDSTSLARRVSASAGGESRQPLGHEPATDLRAARLRAGGHRAAGLSAFAELALKPQGVRK
jgi:hypothetical protein